MSWFLNGSLFRPSAETVFIATAVMIALHFVISRPKLDDVFGKDRSLRILDGLRCLVCFITLLFVEQKGGLVTAVRKLVFLLALFCFVVLLVTGFVPMFFLGKTITGWWLMIHATAAPVFAGCMAILAVIWADKNRLDKNYWPWLNKILQRSPKSGALPQKYELESKICFWVLLFLSLPAILSETLSMFYLFGTAGQEALLQIHRYSTLLLSVSAIIYLYLAALSEIEKTAK